MGCDIHLYFEKINHKGIWEQVEITPEEIIPDDRSYYLFAFLFNVRNYEEFKIPISKFSNRGIPEDSCIEKVIEYECLHSITYILGSEISQIIWPEDLKDCYFRIFLQNVFPRISDMWNIDGSDIRIIIGFDN